MTKSLKINLDSCFNQWRLVIQHHLSPHVSRVRGFWTLSRFTVLIHPSSCELLVRVRRLSRFCIPSIHQFIVTVYYKLITNDDFPVIIVSKSMNYNYPQSKPVLFLRHVLYIIHMSTVPYCTYEYCTVLYIWVQYRTVHMSTVPYCTYEYSTVLYIWVQYRTVHMSTVPYCTYEYSTVLYSYVQYGTVLICTVPYCTYEYCTVLYIWVQYHTVLICTVRYSTCLLYMQYSVCLCWWLNVVESRYCRS